MTIYIYIQEEKKVIDYSCMKAKRLFLILSIFSFIPLSAIAQDYIPDLTSKAKNSRKSTDKGPKRHRRKLLNQKAHPRRRQKKAEK